MLFVVTHRWFYTHRGLCFVGWDWGAQQSRWMIYLMRSLSVNTQVREKCVYVSHTSDAGQDQTRQKVLNLQPHGGPRWKVITLMVAPECPRISWEGCSKSVFKTTALKHSIYYFSRLEYIWLTTYCSDYFYKAGREQLFTTFNVNKSKD